MRIKPAVNSPAGSAGSRPYEMKKRKEDRVPLVDFEDLSGWTVECAGGADAEFSRSREQQMWGDYVAKLAYTGKADSDKVTLRPPKPIPINGEFNCINMWIYGNLWEWAPDPGTPFVNIAILFTDKDGKEERLPLGRVRWKEWFMDHNKLDTTASAKSFSGIEVSGMNNSEPRTIYLDSLYFYKEALKPLEFKPRPARNLTPLPGQETGLNGTGKGRLPFPTREETILPTNFESNYKNSTQEIGPREYEFTYKAADCTVKYVYSPAKGDLGEISSYVNGREAITPMAAGGIEIDGEQANGRLIEASVKNNAVHAIFEVNTNSACKIEYVFRIWQKSLVIDAICKDGKASGLSFGEIAGANNLKLIQIPYLTFGGSNPRVLCSDTKDGPVFTSVWADWYRSNGSELWADAWTKDHSAKINGGVRYNAKTDGKRNDLYERIFLTISPTFEETLPTIANPPSPRGKEAGERLWQESWGPENYAKEMERSRILRSYGIDMLTQCNHEITWRDGGESFTLRTKAAPGKGGDGALKKYINHQKSLGWLSGLYTNYTDFAPVNENWNEDYVQFDLQGNWRAAWPRNYALKPSRAVELDAKYAPIIKKKYESNAAYTDVQTAVAPWNYCDYDARVPGAATFAATFYAYGELLLNDQKVYGPIWSEGTFHWMYAGLASGNYGIVYADFDPAKAPLNVAFDLMKIHSLECDIGVPWTDRFFRNMQGWDKQENIDKSIDQFIATTIAYGHIGWLVEEKYGIERTCRSYYMLQQIQKRYVMQRVKDINYGQAGSEKQLNASQAIASGAIDKSWLHLTYENGLQIWVNGSTEDWPEGGASFWKGPTKSLSPWGWIIVDDKDNFIEFSTKVKLPNQPAHRVDYVKSPEYEYLDGRGVQTEYGGLSTKGAIAVRRKSENIEVIDIYGNDAIGLVVPPGYSCIAYDANGKSLGNVDISGANGTGMVSFKTIKNARRYLLSSAQ